MASFPTLSVRVALGANPLASTVTWTELGPASGAGPGGKGWVRSVKTSRGRDRLLRSQAQFQAGTATVELDNRDRRFDPTNTAGPYWPNLQPETRIQIGATWAGTFYPIWTGYADDLQQNWPGFAEGSCAMPATDLFKTLALGRVMNTGYAAAVLALNPAMFLRCDDKPGATRLYDTVTGAGGGQVLPAPGAAIVPGQPGPLAGEPGETGSQLPTYTLPSSVPTLSGHTGGWTFQCWAQFGAANAGVALFTAFDNSVGNGVQCVFNATNGTIVMNAATPAGSASTQLDPWLPGALNDLAWHLVTVVMATNLATLYIDGVAAGPQLAIAPSGAPVVPSTAPLWVSSFDSTGITPQNVNLADIAVYTAALTAPTILRQYQAGMWPAETTGARFNRILGIANIPPALANVDVGQTVCQPSNTDETQTKLLDYLQKIESTEQGQCYVAAGGLLTFAGRYRRFRGTATQPVATFGDGGPAYPLELPYAMGGVTLNFDRSELYNDVPVTRRGDAAILQEAVNQASVNQFTNRTMDGLSDLLMAADTDALGCAQFILADTAYPQFRVSDLKIDMTVNARLWPVVLALEVGQVVTVNKHHIPGGGPALSVNCRIEGIEHDISAPRRWAVTLHVSIADSTKWLILDDPYHGTLDTGCCWAW